MLRRTVLILSLAAAAAGWAWSAPPGEFRLANGLRVALRPIPGAQRAALVVLFSIGGDQDPAGSSGLAHLVEHVYVTAAAGPMKARTAEEWMQQSQGNAQTGEDHTLVGEMFSPRELRGRLAEAAARMGDLRVQPPDLEREKPRLIAEVTNMFGGMPALGAWNLAYERVRPSPAGARRGGAPAQVSAITIEQVRERWRRYYKPRNAVLVLAGAFDASEARKLVASAFGGLPSGEAPPPARAHPAPSPGPVREVSTKPIVSDGAPPVTVMYAAPAFSSHEFPAFLVLVSRLLQQSRQLAGTGTPGFPPPVHYAPVDAPHVIALNSRLRAGETPDQAAERIQKVLAAALKPPLRQEDVAAARMNPGLLLGIAAVPDSFWSQNPYGLALLTGYRIRTGYDPTRISSALDHVKDADLRRCAERVFSLNKRAVVVVRSP